MYKYKSIFIIKGSTRKGGKKKAEDDKSWLTFTRYRGLISVRVLGHLGGICKHQVNVITITGSVYVSIEVIV